MSDTYKILLVLALILVQIAGECKFPDEWVGRWYQNGLGEVVIQKNSIEKKGECAEKKKDHYILFNRESHCYQCMVAKKRHRNIIQYKTSFCLGRESLHNICSHIQSDAFWYTMIRDPSLPVRCPFQDAYHFSYNNNTGGFCMAPMSYVHACASDASFRFQYKHCEDAAYTHNQNMELECIATWSDGKDHFMYGAFMEEDSLVSERKELYRCFMYQQLGTVIYIAMSADATCRGIRSPRDGPLVMELTKDVFGWPQPTCQFPEWLTRHTWQDLENSHLFIPDPSGMTVAVTYRHFAHSVPRDRYAIRCSRVQSEDTTSNKFTAVSYTSDDCDAKFQCIQIKRRHTGVIELHLGGTVQWETDVCSENHFSASKVYILIPRHMPSQPCPYPGRFPVLPRYSNCEKDVLSGCESPSSLTITSTCETKPVFKFECLQSWEENGMEMLIARNSRDTRKGSAVCLSYRRTGDTIEFSTQQDCNANSQLVFSEGIQYILDGNTAECRLPQQQEIHTSIHQQSDSQYSYDSRLSEEKGYKHTAVDTNNNNYVLEDSEYEDSELADSSFLNSQSTRISSCLRTMLFLVCLSTSILCIDR